MKPGDDKAVPLCHNCHTEQHQNGERTFWGKHLEAAQGLANALWVRSKDIESGIMQVFRFRKVFNG